MFVMINGCIYKALSTQNGLKCNCLLTHTTSTCKLPRWVLVQHFSSRTGARIQKKTLQCGLQDLQEESNGPVSSGRSALLTLSVVVHCVVSVENYRLQLGSGAVIKLQSLPPAACYGITEESHHYYIF